MDMGKGSDAKGTKQHAYHRDLERDRCIGVDGTVWCALRDQECTRDSRELINHCNWSSHATLVPMRARRCHPEFAICISAESCRDASREGGRLAATRCRPALGCLALDRRGVLQLDDPSVAGRWSCRRHADGCAQSSACDRFWRRTTQPSHARVLRIASDGGDRVEGRCALPIFCSMSESAFTGAAGAGAMALEGQTRSSCATLTEDHSLVACCIQCRIRGCVRTFRRCLASGRPLTSSARWSHACDFRYDRDSPTCAATAVQPCDAPSRQ